MEESSWPAWFQPREDVSFLGTPCLWLVLCVSAPTRRSRELEDVLDQIEPALHGGWSRPDADLEDRARVALAHCVAKSWGTPAEDALRDMLEDAGVVNWHQFVADVVYGSAIFHWRMATFQTKDHYRWVAVTDIPVPEKPHRLPRALDSLWDEVVNESVGRRRRGGADVATEWVRRLKEHPALARDWDLVTTNWAEATSLVRRFWELNPDQWTQQRAFAYTEPVESGNLLGARCLLVDPIVWRPGSEFLGNGRHRVLALLLQGVPDVLVCDR